MFSVSITHHSKIRELSDGNRAMEIELSFGQTTFLLWVPPFWVMSYGNWELSCGNCLSKQALEFWCLPNFPCQQANNSPTIFGITQWMPNKVNTIYHKSKAIVQQMRRWSTDSPFLLHIQHQSKIKICCFLRLSIVKIFPKVAIHTKKQF